MATTPTTATTTSTRAIFHLYAQRWERVLSTILGLAAGDALGSTSELQVSSKRMWMLLGIIIIHLIAKVKVTVL